MKIKYVSIAQKYSLNRKIAKRVVITPPKNTNTNFSLVFIML
jgi:hypothetical protein